MNSNFYHELHPYLATLPLVQYELFDANTLPFSEKVRYICKTECPRYGSTWACPPAVGTVEECKSRCLSYDKVLLFVTMEEVSDAASFAATAPSQARHEALTREVCSFFTLHKIDHMALSSDSCRLCSSCTYPNAPCCQPGNMLPCIEGHGILVTELAERFGLSFLAGGNLVTWYSLILFHD